MKVSTGTRIIDDQEQANSLHIYQEEALNGHNDENNKLQVQEQKERLRNCLTKAGGPSEFEPHGQKCIEYYLFKFPIK